LEILKYISIFFFASFIGGFPPGLVNMSVAKVVLKKNKKNAYIAAAGACLALFLQGVIGISLAKYIIKQAGMQTNMLKIGLFIFGFLSIYFLIAALKNKPIKTKTSSKQSGKSFATGFFISALNILPLPYYIIISTQLRPDMREFYTWPRIVVFGLAIAAATFIVLSLYITAFLKLKKKTNLLVQYANFFMSGLMLIIFIITLLRIIYA